MKKSGKKKDWKWFADEFVKVWVKYDARTSGEEFYASLNEIQDLIDLYKKTLGEDEYVMWHEAKVRRIRCAPFLHNGSFVNSVAESLRG